MKDAAHIRKEVGIAIRIFRVFGETAMTLKEYAEKMQVPWRDLMTVERGDWNEKDDPSAKAAYKTLVDALGGDPETILRQAEQIARAQNVPSSYFRQPPMRKRLGALTE